jgi:2-amino-4-hydroxy-6-hydroxymethyldihydropteridine diphosphokinase
LSEAVFLGAGARDGDRVSTLTLALRLLGARGVTVRRASSLYETEPIDLPGERTLINAAVEVASPHSPEELLGICLGVEEDLGRRRATRPDGPDTGPRPIDLDLLLWGGLEIRQPGLTLPHPRMHRRRFVLVPMAEIAPHVVHPTLGADMTTLLSRCEDAGRVELWQPPSAWWSGPAGEHPR